MHAPSSKTTFLKKTIQILLIILLAVAALLYFGFQASLPVLEGTLQDTAITKAVQIERDKNGNATITASNRADMAFATGFLHAQERFFQMDLYRKLAAGELSSLFGSIALEEDKKHRFHQFRKRAEQVLEQLPKDHRNLLDAYVKGVNAGMDNLSSNPFEYWLLQAEPQAWQITDTLLVTYAMFLDLQDEFAEGKWRRSLIKKAFSQDIFDFLVPLQTEWDAPIEPDAKPWKQPTIPDFSSTKNQQGLAKTSLKHNDEIQTGSSNWAVSGLLTESGASILSNDMHLGIQAPATWFRLHLKLKDGSLDVSGVSLPGTPLVVAGSNKSVAWGFTNNRMNTTDLIELKLNPNDSNEYLTTEGYKAFTSETETIIANDGKTVTLEIQKTIWGPVLNTVTNNTPLAIRWTGHLPDALNVNLAKMEQVQSVAEALELAPTMGMAPQNALIADKHGNVAWTVFGRIPTKTMGDYTEPGDWSDGTLGWTGWTNYEQHPRIVNPDHGRLWTANNRPVTGKKLETLGNARGFVNGARGMQIRDALFALQKPVVEDDLFQIMFDDRALFLSRWQTHLVSVLGVTKNKELQAFSEAVDNWGARAEPNSIGYRLIRNYRYKVYEKVMGQINTACHTVHPDCNYKNATLNWETPLWQLISNRPKSWLPTEYTDWQEFFEAMALEAWEPVVSGETALQDYTWGEHTRSQFNHPLSSSVPGLGWLADMPHEPQAGEHEYMPKVTTRSSGQSEHMVVTPGNEKDGILNIPSGQSGHPLSPYFGAGHDAWMKGERTPFLHGKTKWQLTLTPASK